LIVLINPNKVLLTLVAMEGILPGFCLLCTTAGPLCPHLKRIRGRTLKKRRETTKNEGNRRDGNRTRTTLVAPLDTPSVGTGPLYSASPAEWLQQKIGARQVSDWLSVSACAMSSSSSPRRCLPPPSGATVGFLAHPAAEEKEKLPTAEKMTIEWRKRRRFGLGYFSAR